jgi:hypothetical protein
MWRPTKKTFGQDAGLLVIRASPDELSKFQGRLLATGGGNFLKRKNLDSKTNLDVRADRAIEIARKMPPGVVRNNAMKKAGLLRLMADLTREIATKERPVRGKKPYRAKPKNPASGLSSGVWNER